MDAMNEHFRFYTFMRLKLGDNGKKILQDLQAVFGAKCVDQQQDEDNDNDDSSKDDSCQQADTQAAAVCRLFHYVHNLAMVWCGAGLTYIPDLPVDIIQLDFSDNNLTRLTEGTLRNLSSLQTLIVRKNQIASIHPSAFQDMGLLTTVDLSGNQLSDFDEMVMGLKSAAVLEKLDANHNAFEDLPLESLSRIPGLLLLFLSGNKIRSVSKRKSQTTIGNSYNLHSLDLRTNRFSEFPNFCRDNGSDESYLPNLRTLEIQWNQITNTDSRSLACLPELVALRMDGNPVYHIHRDFFGGLPGLQFVTMTFCTSRTIDEYAFRHPTIQHLDVSENLWFLRRAGDSGTDPGLFLDMPQLRFINMSWTVFRYWDKGLSDEMLMSISNLTSFVVQGTGLDHIPQTILKHFRNLEFLGVRENEIAFLPENMFENLTALRALDLSHNHLTTISQTWMESFLSPADPVSIDLSGNPFSCTCDQLWFIELYKKDIKRDPGE
nr:hypothetical protein BaRGS_014867 [Batillaria attramentaria]